MKTDYTSQIRLDRALVEQGLAPSRTKAQELISRGDVFVNHLPAGKASRLIGPEDRLQVLYKGKEYVSRGAWKLLGAFDAFQPEGLILPQGLDCLDIGASTGGFTQVLLEKGARRVIALDVGHGQLDPRVSQDQRVTDLSGVNFRQVATQDLPFLPSYAVSDVSFISLTFIIPPLAGLAQAFLQANPGRTFTAILLVKPQFEVGKGNLGKGGIVTDDFLREKAVERVITCAGENGFQVRSCRPSPITGTHGNEEFLLWLTR